MSCNGLRRRRGYTYVGVLALIAILAIASVATLSAGSAMQQRMAEEELLFIGGEFALAFRSYYDATPAGQRNYPARLEELLRDPRYPGVRRHLRKIYVDPLTGTAQWGLVAAPNGIVGVHSLSQRAPLKVEQFAPAFAPLTGKNSYVDWKFGFLPPELALGSSLALAGAPPAIVKPAPQKPPTLPVDVPVPRAPTIGPLAPGVPVAPPVPEAPPPAPPLVPPFAR